MPNIQEKLRRGKELNRRKDAGLYAGLEQAPMIFRNNIGDGVTAFGLWLNSHADSESSPPAAVPISVKKFVPDHLAVLDDRAMQKEVFVVFTDGVPSCSECADSENCIHVGFAICLEQSNAHSGLY